MSRSDFSIAMGTSESGPLLPDGITWKEWQDIVRAMTQDANFSERDRVNQRYKYGELRLARLNHVWRFAPSMLFSSKHSIIRGYHYGYNRYNTFFKDNFAWLIVVFAYVTIMLTGMQVGLALDRLKSTGPFLNACYGFAIFPIVLSVVFVGITVAAFVILILDNAFATVLNLAKHRQKVQPKEKDITVKASHPV